LVCWLLLLLLAQVPLRGLLLLLLLGWQKEQQQQHWTSQTADHSLARALPLPVPQLTAAYPNHQCCCQQQALKLPQL
jgi:hypothetical protein